MAQHTATPSSKRRRREQSPPKPPSATNPTFRNPSSNTFVTVTEIRSISPQITNPQTTLYQELTRFDPGHNIVQIKFKSGWPETNEFPSIHRILKIHNSQKILSEFEEYREIVKSKATRNTRRRRERSSAEPLCSVNVAAVRGLQRGRSFVDATARLFSNLAFFGSGGVWFFSRF